MGRNGRAQGIKTGEEQIFHTVYRDSRLMGVCEQNRSKGPTGRISNRYTLVLHCFDFIFCSGEKVHKGKRHTRDFYLVLLSPFNGAFATGEGNGREIRKAKRIQESNRSKQGSVDGVR